MHERLRIFFTLLILLLPAPGRSLAEGEPTDPAPSLPDLPRAGRWKPPPRPPGAPPNGGGLLGNVFGARYTDGAKRLWEEHGFSAGGYFSASAQWGSEDSALHAVSEVVLLATWEPIRRPGQAGRLVAGFAHDQTFDRPNGREFGNLQRLVEIPNDLDTDPGLSFTTLGLLHWEHEFETGPDRGFGFRAGQLYALNYFAGSVYFDDDRRYFQARPLATPASANWVGDHDIGLGANLIGWRGPLYVSAAVMDGKANRKYPDFGSFFDGEFLYLAEFGFERDLAGPDGAALRLTYGYLDVEDGSEPGKGPGHTLILSGVKRLRGQVAIAGRWAKSFDRLSAAHREHGSLGLLWLEPFKRPQDVVGLGAFVGDPSASDKGVESGLELFYRIQLVRGILVTPDLQYWWRDDDQGPGAGTWVFTLRFNLEF